MASAGAADGTDAIIGRVSDGRLLNDVPVHLVDPATGDILLTVTTRSCPNGFAGFFALPRSRLGPPGSRAKLCVVLSDNQDAIADLAVPDPGDVVDVRFVLPPPPMKAVAATPDRDADTCSSCLLESLFTPYEADETGRLINPARAGRGQMAALAAGDAASRFAATLVVDEDALPPDCTWHVFRTGGVEVAYASTGTHALPAAQCAPASEDAFVAGGWVRAGEVPACVQQVALIAARAWAVFTDLHGLRDPAPDGTLRIRLCRIDVETRQGPRPVFGQTDAAWNHLRVNVANTMAQNEGTVPHEIFHRIQYRYNASDEPGAELHRALREGGATLAEESLEPEANRYVLRARDYFSTPWVPIAAARRDGASQPYAAALFWRYLEEQRPGVAAEAPRIGPGPDLAVMRLILEATATIGQALPAGASGYRVAALRERLIRAARFDRFRVLPDPERTPACTDTLYGNWLLANALTRCADRIADPRFRYEEFDHPTPPTLTASGEEVPPMRLIDLPRPVMDGDAMLLRAGRKVLVARGTALPAWSARYFRLAGEGLFRIIFTGDQGADPPIVQLARLAADGTLAIRRGQGPAYSASILVRPDDELVLVVGARGRADRFRLDIAALPPAPLPFITGWNCAAGDGHETNDAAGPPWTWTSPDIVPAAAGGARSGAPGPLSIRVRNLGNAEARQGSLRLECARAADLDAPFAFTPATSPAGVPIALPIPPLPAGRSSWIEADWAPPGDAPPPHWIIRAIASLPDAPETACALGRLGPWPC